MVNKQFLSLVNFLAIGFCESRAKKNQTACMKDVDLNLHLAVFGESSERDERGDPHLLVENS